MLSDNIYGHVSLTEAWCKQKRKICYNQHEEAAARKSSLMEASPPCAELPIREPSLMREDDSNIIIDSLNWIFQ
jgi:hypothetical protein